MRHILTLKEKPEKVPCTAFPDGAVTRIPTKAHYVIIVKKK